MSEFRTTNEAVSDLLGALNVAVSRSPPAPPDWEDIGDKKSTLTSVYLLSLKGSYEELCGKMPRYRERLTEFDPVTKNPRYGAGMTAKVKTMLGNFDAMTEIMEGPFPEILSGVQSVEEEISLAASAEAALNAESSHRIAAAAALELEEAKRQEAERIAAKRREEEAQRLELSAAAEAARRRKAEQAAAELEAAERAAAEERAWVASIPVNIDSVRKQLRRLPPNSRSIFHILFQQIQKHPENETFRKMKLENEKFKADFADHEGGKEVFIAAGFKLQHVDDTTLLVLREPNLESDFDGWSTWFDYIKLCATVAEQELGGLHL